MSTARVVDLTFKTAEEYKRAQDIAIAVSETHPYPEREPIYVIASVGEEQIETLKERLAEEGINYEQTYEGEIGI